MKTATHTGTNGTRHASPAAPQAANPLRIFRICPDMEVFVRTLSDRYGGLLTHWVQGRSKYCHGKDCDPLIHKKGFVWKGYGAVELYDKAKSKWVPVVLEITEAVELDFRNQWKRGQVWKIAREEQRSKRPTPVTATLWEERDPDTLPAAFDIRPPLMHLYHVNLIHLDTPNPMPPRIFVTESEGEAPRNMDPAVEPAGPWKPEVEEAFKRRLESIGRVPAEPETPNRTRR